MSFRIVDEAQLDAASISGIRQTQRPFTKPSTPLRLSVRSIVKATSSATVAYSSISPAPLINESMLDDLPAENRLLVMVVLVHAHKWHTKICSLFVLKGWRRKKYPYRH